MDSIYGMIFVHIFYLVILAGLIHYYRRLRYPFLLYGAISMVFVLPTKVVDYLPALELSRITEAAGVGAVSLVYAALLLACVADIVGRALPIRWIAGAGVLYAAAFGWAIFAGITTLSWLALYAPCIALLGLAIAWLLMGRDKDSIGSLWFAGLILVGASIALIEPLTGGVQPLAHHGILDDLLHILIGVALIMITSERTISDLSSKEQRIEDYAEEHKRLELQFSHAQKLESLGVMAGGIAHDFNNMLTSILGYASLAMKKLPNDSEIRKDLYMVMSGARQAVDLTSQMLIYAGKGAVEFEAVDISKVVDNMSSLMHSIVPRKIELVERLGRDLPSVKGDAVQLGQVVMNLVANAADAMENDTGVIEVSTGLTDARESLLSQSLFADEREPGAYVFVCVKDSGIGMTDEQVARIFDPFYSEKQTNKGLGLASLSGIVRQHKGFIRVLSSPGQGSEFAVYFPAISYEEASDKRRVPGLRHRARGRVLLADDDPRIRSLMASILESDHYTIVSAEDGKEAQKIFDDSPDDFDILVLDCTMPKVSGGDIYSKVRQSGFDIPVVLVSGYHQEQVAHSIDNDPNAYFIKKPFNVDDFLSEVSGALRAYHSA